MPPRAAGPLASEEMGQLEHTLPQQHHGSCVAWRSLPALPRTQPGWGFPSSNSPQTHPMGTPFPTLPPRSPPSTRQREHTPTHLPAQGTPCDSPPNITVINMAVVGTDPSDPQFPTWGRSWGGAGLQDGPWVDADQGGDGWVGSSRAPCSAQGVSAANPGSLAFFSRLLDQRRQVPSPAPSASFQAGLHDSGSCQEV